MPVPGLAPDPGQRVLHCHVNWVNTHLHNSTQIRILFYSCYFINSWTIWLFFVPTTDSLIQGYVVINICDTKLHYYVIN